MGRSASIAYKGIATIRYIAVDGVLEISYVSVLSFIREKKQENGYGKGQEMEIKDMIKRAFLDGYATGNITIGIVFVCILCTVVIAAYIYFVYKYINKNSFYNKGFNLSLILLALITSAIILTIQSNIVVSLGMVGALSIVRFRTAIKDPMDLVFLFWSISIGIICGAGFAIIAVIVSGVITIVTAVVSVSATSRGTLLLVINAKSYENEADIIEQVDELCQFSRIRARNASKDNLNLAIEVKIDEPGDLIKILMEMDCIVNTSLVEHDGDVTV